MMTSGAAVSNSVRSFVCLDIRSSAGFVSFYRAPGRPWLLPFSWWWSYRCRSQDTTNRQRNDRPSHLRRGALSYLSHALAENHLPRRKRIIMPWNPLFMISPKFSAFSPTEPEIIKLLVRGFVNKGWQNTAKPSIHRRLINRSYPKNIQLTFF